MSLIDYPVSRVCGGYCIDYGYPDMYLSETCSSKIDVNYTDDYNYGALSANNPDLRLDDTLTNDNKLHQIICNNFKIDYF